MPFVLLRKQQTEVNPSLLLIVRQQARKHMTFLQVVSREKCFRKVDICEAYCNQNTEVHYVQQKTMTGVDLNFPWVTHNNNRILYQTIC